MPLQKCVSPAHRVDGGRARKADQLGGRVSNQNSVSPGCLQIVVAPTRGRRFRATFDGETLCLCTAPLVVAARILIARGFDPSLTIEMVHAGARTWALRGRLGIVAATVLDGETAPRCAKNGSPADENSDPATPPTGRVMNTKRRARQCGRWWWVFDRQNRPRAVVEQRSDGWHVIIRDRDVGVVASAKAADDLARRIIDGGSR